jgi:hypothetical protein
MADGTVTRATGTQAQIHDAGGWAAPTAIRYLGLASAASESESAAAVPAAAAVATAAKPEGWSEEEEPEEGLGAPFDESESDVS